MKELLAQLATHDIKLWLKEGRLNVSAPPGVLTPELRNQLAAHKAELLALLQQQATLQPIPRAEHQGLAPLSYAQQRLWFLAQLQTTGTAYHLATLLHLRGRLVLPALQQSLTTLVERHEILRTTYTVIDGVPRQCIGAPPPVQITAIDLTTLPTAQQRAQVIERTQQEQARGFDLARGPLWRFVLFHLAEESSMLAILMHHLITDEWSTGILLREISACYTGFVKQQAVALPPLAIQYADYAIWQQQQLATPHWQQQLADWQQALQDAPTRLQLPVDQPPVATPTMRADAVYLELDGRLTATLKTLAQAVGATPYTVLLSAFALLLARYSQQQDLVIGSPVANRERSEVEPLIGFFVNTLPLRINLGGDPTFRTLLADVRQRVLDAMAHVNIPFEQLVEALQPARHLAQNPLFQAMFVWQTGPREPLHLPDLRIEPVVLPITNLPVDLLLALGEEEEMITGWLRYSTDHFSAGLMQRMAAHFHYLLAMLVSQPDAPMHSLPLLPPHEQQRLLVDWNGLADDELVPVCLHHLFEAQVTRTPHATAIHHPGQPMSYAELNQQANQLAHRLLARGIGIGTRVAICAERTPALLVAILGVLKSGAAYVPIDPDYPPERLAYLLADAQVALLLTQSHLVAQLPAGDWPHLLLDQAPTLATMAVSNPTSPVTPTDPAYLIYTSGSTGHPKGVVVPHAGVANTVRAIARTVELGPADRLLQFVPFSFDASALDFFATLAVGAALVFHPHPTRLSAGELFALCCQAQVTVVNFTVALWQQWVDNLVRQGVRFPDHLRVFLVGGDKPAAPTLRTWATLGDHPMIFLCSYGPTEASITTTIYVTTNEEVRRDPPTTIPLGHPLPNSAIYLLDAHQQLVPIGVPGEIYIGGVGVAHGYWQRPALTSERFLPSLPSVTPPPSLIGQETVPPPNGGRLAAPFEQARPVPKGGGPRFYRTGDLARWLPDGACEFMGRVDTQVKIRGFRIELGEIESQLKGLPIVREAVVAALAFGDEDKRLVAYVQPAHDMISQSALAAALQAHLPAHLLPSVWVMMNDWPLTPNGKIDRAALPPPTLQDTSAHFVAPDTPLETALAAIWCAVLGIAAISVESNFFALGGHSLLATQVVARIQQQLGEAVALRTLFEKPTIRQLAAAIEGTAATTATTTRPPLHPVARTAPLPLSFAQQRLWLIQQLDPASIGYSIPSALRLHGQLDAVALQGALDAVVARHESLRTRFVVADGEAVQIIDPPQAVPLARVDLRHLPPAEREAAAEAQAVAAMHNPFDLAVGPLLRATLYHLAADEAILFVLMHHIITDGWSIPILLSEVTERYTAQRQGRTSRLAPLTIQYADYAHWQRGWLRGAVLQEQLAYWHAHLADAPPLLSLPTSHPRPAEPTYQAAMLEFMIAAPVVAQLQSLAQAHDATLYMAVLSAFALLLARYSGQSDLVIGTPIANRTHPALEGLIGFFVNTLALRIDLHGAPSFVELLQRVRQTTLAAYAHQDAPFEQVIEALHLPRTRSHAPLCQVLLAWQAITEQPTAVNLPDLALQSVAWQKPTTEYDLTLTVAESAGALAMAWHYRTDLFDEPMMAQMAGHLQTLLAAVSHQPTALVNKIPLITGAELTQLLAHSTGPVQPELAERCLHHCFEAQAAHSPAAPALFFQEQVISYQALNEQANRLAHYLSAQGYGPGERLAIGMTRTPALVAAVLAVLKIGAAYLPLDPDYPAERLAYLLADAGAACLLTQSPLVAGLPTTDLPVYCLDQLDRSGLPTTNPVRAVTPADPFYQIYTSGSTGLPKGVVVPHAGVANTIQALARRIALGPGDRLFAFVPLGFDAAALEIFAPLICGAALVLHPTPTRLSATELLAAYRNYDVTVAHLSTAAWQQWAHNLALQGERCPAHLRVCLTGGEKPAPQSLRTWADLGDHEMLFVSSYGPSEASIIATTYVTTNRTVRAATPPQIGLGEPLPNVALYLLDEAGELAPTGVPGELYIGGIGVATGYWQRPDLTAEHFVTVPSAIMQSPPPGLPLAGAGTVPPPARDGLGRSTRLYRTGDLARRLPDGSYEFIGRADSQVKIRGFRIELGEIESQIKQLPGVREAVVIALTTEAGDKRLVAYVQPVAAGIDQQAVAAALQRRLPPHLLPAAWVWLTTWPLTPHGKIDRRQLPPPTFTTPPEAYVAPSSPLENKLADIWQVVLGVAAVSVTSNFFDLGGHSLSATQVVARIQQELGLAVALRTLFDKPTIAELAIELSSGLPVASPASVRPPLHKVPRDGGLPLSFGQQRLWLMQQLNPGSGFFNMPAALWLEGPLCHAALQAAFTSMAQRHEVLRTTFPLVDGRPVQQISPEATLPIATYLAAGDPPLLDEESLIDWVTAEAERPFDLQQGPLVRLVLRQIAPERHLLLVTMHHIIGDDWSRRRFMQEFSALYQGYMVGTPVTLPEQTVQYADFAQWQRAWLQGPLLQQQLAYWRAHLADAPPLLELPTDYPRPAQQRFVGDRLVVALPAALAAGLRTFSRQQQSTLHMTLLAGFAALLARYSGMDDLVIGIPVAGRTTPEVEGLLGFFLNTLALRIRLDEQPGFAALVAQVKQVTLDGYAHQEAPFEQVIEVVKPTPQLSHTPIFQVMFDLLQADAEPFTLAGLQVRPLDFSTHSAKFDLNLVFQEGSPPPDEPSGASATTLVATWEYNSDLFARATIEQMAQQLHHLLQAALAAPECPVSQLPLLTADERHHLLTAWNPAAATAPAPFCMQQRFEAQAAQTPDAIAVAHGAAHLTYRQLNERANRWARTLVTQGVTADVVVALYWARDLDFLTAILAIFKAGGAYLPLDPQTPPARLGQILAQSRTPLVLTNAAFLPVVEASLVDLPEAARPQVRRIETLLDGSESGENLPPRNRPNALAYVIYTSGSTGLPKGVMVEQRGLVNHLLAMQQKLGLGAGDVIGQTATQSYVISVWQWLAALVSGGRVELVDDEQVRDPDTLLATIAQQQISVVQVVPSLLRLLVAAIQQQQALGQRRLLPHLRWMIPTGEALPPALARAWFSVCPHIPLLNAYGSSECADDVTHDLITAPPDETVVAMPIGVPLPHVQIYVLDDHLAPAPLGVAGELYVGGVGVGRGYLYDAERTAQRFLPNPFSSDPAARLYKTGDRVRRLRNGTVEYLGRVDFQVKVRGIRIELGEIEATLSSHPAVAQAVVVTGDDPAGMKQLLAYVVVKRGQPATGQALRAFLSEHLPAYLVPSAILLLDHFPLTTSGKVARTRLPTVTQGQIGADETYVAPRNTVETTLVEILSAVLGMAPAAIGVQHNFFDLGANSMQAIQLVWQLRDRLGVELPLRSLFAATTVEQLANLVIDAQLAQLDAATIEAILGEVIGEA